MRWACIVALVFLATCQQPAPTDVTVRTDAPLLGQRIQLPDGIESARWSVVPLGAVGGLAPGPTDTRLYAYLQPHLAAAASLTSMASDQQPTAAAVPPDIASLLIPADTLATLQSDAAGDLLLPGQRYDPRAFDRGSYHGVFAVQLGDGVLVCLQTS